MSIRSTYRGCNSLTSSTSFSRPDVTCSQPYTPHLQTVAKRLLTFRNWPNLPETASPASLSEAGFFYLGSHDRVKCFNCNGGLQNWEPGDEPWTEHAKWFPECEFLQLCKGVDFVQRIVSSNPGFQRLQIHNSIPLPRNDSTSRTVEANDVMTQQETSSIDARVNTAMTREIVQMVLMMTSDESGIRNLVKRKLEEEGAEYDSMLSLVEDLQKTEETQRATTPIDDHMEWSDVSSGPSTDVSRRSSGLFGGPLTESSSKDILLPELFSGLVLMNPLLVPMPLPNDTNYYVSEKDFKEPSRDETCRACPFHSCHHHHCCCVQCCQSARSEEWNGRRVRRRMRSRYQSDGRESSKGRQGGEISWGTQVRRLVDRMGRESRSGSREMWLSTTSMDRIGRESRSESRDRWPRGRSSRSVDRISGERFLRSRETWLSNMSVDRIGLENWPGNRERRSRRSDNRNGWRIRSGSRERWSSRSNDYSSRSGSRESWSNMSNNRVGRKSRSRSRKNWSRVGSSRSVNHSGLESQSGSRETLSTSMLGNRVDRESRTRSRERRGYHHVQRSRRTRESND